MALILYEMVVITTILMLKMKNSQITGKNIGD